jgi:glycine/D-amino acid oxidase-like deaminating enzyme
VAPPPLDTLIIGQGLAGSALAWHLLRRGRRVLVIDDGHQSAASRVAAGLVNPLAGMRFSRRKQLPDWLASSRRWYADVGAECGQRLWHPLPMLRLFRSAEQRRFFQRRHEEPGSEALLGELFGPADCPEPVSAPFGGFRQYETGYVDLPQLLDGMRRWLERQGCLHRRSRQPTRR